MSDEATKYTGEHVYGKGAAVGGQSIGQTGNTQGGSWTYPHPGPCSCRRCPCCGGYLPYYQPAYPWPNWGGGVIYTTTLGGNR